MRYLQIFVTVPDRRSASRLSRVLLEERLAACVQVFGSITSRYWWQGRIEQSREWLLVIKTGKAQYARLERRIRELHPYQVPEVIAVPVAAGYRLYLDWLNSELAAGNRSARGR